MKDKLEINVPGMSNRRTPPDAPNPGDRYYDVIKEKICVFDGNRWTECAPITAQDVEMSAISIFSKENLEVLRIEKDGKIFWRKPEVEELAPVEMDSDLSLAFALCVETISGLKSSTLMQKIKEDAVREYLNKKAPE